MPWHGEDAVVRNIAFNTTLELKKLDWRRDEIVGFLESTLLCKSFWGLTKDEIKYFVNLVFEQSDIVDKLREIDFYDIYTDEWDSETFHIIFPACDKLNEAGYLVG